MGAGILLCITEISHQINTFLCQTVKLGKQKRYEPKQSPV